MSIEQIQKTTQDKMKKSLEAFQATLSKIRTGRAHAGLLDHIEVEYYGAMTPLSQVASVNLLDARTLSVQVWEKNIAPIVEKAIRDSDLGLNPQAMGESIRVPMPALTEERRRELTKVVRAEGEDAKVAIRNLRRDANEGFKKLVKDKDISEDQERRAQDLIQKLTDQSVSEVDKLVSQKEAEIMKV